MDENIKKQSDAESNPTISKAKQEINAQADSMLREIEERRLRRAARQRELEQQVQLETEAKARRQARLKAQEEMENKLKEESLKNEFVKEPDALHKFSDAPSKRATQPRNTSEAKSRKPSQRRSISSGETQIMPKISEPKTTESTQVNRARPQSSRPNSWQTKQPNKQNKQKEVNYMKELRDWVIAIAIAVVVSLLIRNFVFTLVKVQGESMQPTLQNEDRLYVNRFFYSPEKGDVVIFKPESDPNRPYIKRVIATEGDTVYIDFENGDVYVNGEVIEEPYIKDATTRSGEYINSLIASGQYSKDKPIVVEKDKIFVMGDNRNNSKDSRMIGQVPKDELIGGAVFRFWPLGKFGSVSYDVSYLIEGEGMNFKISA